MNLKAEKTTDKGKPTLINDPYDLGKFNQLWSDAQNRGVDLIILKVKTLEDFTKKTFLQLLDDRSIYGFPMIKRMGFPSLSMIEYFSWASEHGCAGLLPHQIKPEMLERDLKKRRYREMINKMDPRPLRSINEISELTGFPREIVADLRHRYDGCPIHKNAAGGLECEAKELLLWMTDNGISGGHNRELFPL